MTSDLAGAVKGSLGFLNGSDPCKDFGPFGALHHGVMWRQVRYGTPVRLRTGKVCQTRQIRMGIGNENDQASKGHSVDALACTGDEGRDTLR